MFSSPFIVPVIALCIPIVAIIAKTLRRWQELEIRRAEADVDLRRRFRAFDEAERRIADIERYVTSPEFELNRRFRSLADNKGN
ncbi:hypothetical protein [Oleisolibacter albus]|uniref:hypothetical protein n=1 Tax=Oleisolibacter albus TaxID=2171757 RepID=UPI000DF48FC9|nr:hypothetical protein [Oleisolibacter albus]